MMRRRREEIRNGFTLLESLMASAVLAIVVLAVGAAVSAAQDASLHGQRMLLASMAAEDLLSEISTTPYADLPTLDGLDQPPGQMQTLAGEAYPDTYWSVGRAVLVESASYTHPDLGVQVDGRRVLVTAYDAQRDLVTLETFIPEPAS